MKNFDQDKIDHYLRDELSPKEKAAFLEAINKDQSLKDEVQAQQKVLDHIIDLGDLRLKGLVKEVHQESMSKSIPKSKPIFIYIGLAILALFLVIAIYFLNRPPKHQRLYQAHYSAPQLRLNTRNVDIEEQKKLAIEYWHQRDFKNALPFFKNILAQDSSNSQICLAIGICEMELMKFENAQLRFNKLIQKNDRLYLPQALWYSALIDLHENEIDTCRKKLQELITHPDTYFNEEAQEVLEKIK